MEYFINPSWKVREEFEEEIKHEHSHCTISMYAFSKILYDKNGEMKNLRQDAMKYYEMPFSEIENIKNKSNYCKCWDSYNEFVNRYNSGLKIHIMYVESLKDLINAYIYKNGFSEMPISKIDKLFMDDEFRKKFRYKNMPNDEFCYLVKECFREDDKASMYVNLTALCECVMKDSKYKIEEFSFRSDICRFFAFPSTNFKRRTGILVLFGQIHKPIRAALYRFLVYDYFYLQQHDKYTLFARHDRLKSHLQYRHQLLQQNWLKNFFLKIW